MGNKVSAVHGVKSDHFYDQGNAINEIWVGDVEIISRLPFGDSDLEQAGWPPGGFPKIPWHHFIIPMHKRDEVANITTEHIAMETNNTICACRDWMPKNGYLGMFTGISLDSACFIGASFLTCTAILFMAYISTSMNAFNNWLMLRNLSAHHPDPVRFQRNVWRDLWIGLGRAYIAIVLSVVCMILGLPALAAGWRNVDAPTFILSNGLFACVGVLIAGFILQPLALLWFGRRAAKRNPLGES
jgi:hypothetical protein